MGIFTEDEIYNLVLAQHCAIGVTQESGNPSDYNDFIPGGSDIEEKIAELGDNKLNELEPLINTAAGNCSELFQRLENLNSDDFEEEQEFWDERDKIQKEITNKSLEILRDYCE